MRPVRGRFAVLIISVVWFLRFHLDTGRLWLAWLVCGSRLLALVLNFVFTPNLNYREISGLWQVDLLGESVSAPVGVTNPYTLIGMLSTLLLLLFCVDAALTAWRRGNRRAAAIVGGGASFFVSLSLLQTVLVVWGVIHAPFFFSLAFASDLRCVNSVYPHRNFITDNPRPTVNIGPEGIGIINRGHF